MGLFDDNITSEEIEEVVNDIQMFVAEWDKTLNGRVTKASDFNFAYFVEGKEKETHKVDFIKFKQSFDNKNPLPSIENNVITKRLIDYDNSYMYKWNNYVVKQKTDTQSGGFLSTTRRVILNGGGQKRVVYKKSGKGEEYVKVGGEFVNLKRNYTKKH